MICTYVQINVKPFTVAEGRFYIILIDRFYMSRTSDEMMVSPITIEGMTRYFWL